jgi:type I restriction enzyme S subunit
MSELPEGWTRTALKDLAGSNGLFTDGDWILSEHLRTGNDVRLIQLADIGIGRFLKKSQKFLSRTTADEIGVTYLRKDDVLISRMAHPLARACLFPDLNQPCITAVDVAIARCDETVSSPKFIMHLCNTQYVLNQAEAVAVGTTRKRISRRNLEQISVPLPPLKEQRRIVAKLEELLSRVDAVQTRLATIPHTLRRFRQSVLAAACSGRLTADWRQQNSNIPPATKLIKDNGFRLVVSGDDLQALPAKWQWVPLGNYGKCSRGRFSVRPRSDPRYFGGEYPFIQIGNLPSDGGWITSHHQTLNQKGLDVSKKFPKGTVVIAIVGATIGNTGILSYDMCFTDSMVGIETGSEIGNAYVEFFLRSRKDDIRQSSYAGGGQPNIKLETLNPYPLALPPFAEQQEIVRRVEALFKTADALEARYRTAKAHVDKLEQSILARAFRGELVPQDPNDEPASVLLDRIRKAKDGTSVKKRSARR